MDLGNAGHDETVGEIQVAIGGAVVLGILDGPETLTAILISFLGAEVVVQVLLQTEAGAGVDVQIGIFHHFLQIGLVDRGHLVRRRVILAIGLVEVHLGQERSTGGFRGTAFLRLCLGQHIVGGLQIVDNLLPSLIVGIFGVGEIVVVLLLHVRLVHKGNLLEQAFQLEMAIGAQEQHLSGALLNNGVVLISAGQHVKRQGHTRQEAVELVPDAAEGPVGGHHADTLLQAVEGFAIGEVRTAHVGIIRAGVVVP